MNITRERALQEALDLITAENPSLTATIAARLRIFDNACITAGAPNLLTHRTAEELEQSISREIAWKDPV